MSFFKDSLKSNESVFKNEDALDTEWVPKLLPFREAQQKYIVNCVKPLLQRRNGRNLCVHGSPGIGKTAAIKWIFRDLEENTDEVIPVYVNCWQKNTTYKVFVEICEQVGYKFTQNKNTEDLFAIIKNIVNKKSAVFAFDEIDKVEDYDFLYSLLEDIFLRTIVLITNDKSWVKNLDARIRSRLVPEVLEFLPYSSKETLGILDERVQFAFVPGVFAPDALKVIAEKSFEQKDIRVGLHLLRQAGMYAEEEASRKVLLKHARDAIERGQFTPEKEESLDEDTKAIFDTIKECSGYKIGDVFVQYQERGGASSYKTFQRKVDRLHKAGLVGVEKMTGGAEGSTTVVKFEKDAKLTDF